MNPLSRATWGLLAAVLLVGAVDIGVRVRQQIVSAPLPSIPPIPPLAPIKVTLTHSDDIVVLEKREMTWWVTAPFEFPADKPSVKAILNLLLHGVPMDVEVDRGHYENYGLDQANGILIEIASATGTLTRFYVGENAEGGSTFLRFPDDDRVYRARLGGRSRFERSASEWKDRRIFDLESSTIDNVVVERPSSKLSFSRQFSADEKGGTTPGAWSLDGQPGFPLDQERMQDLADALAKLRAGEILGADAPFDVPVGSVTLHTTTNETHTLTVARHDLGVFARRDSDPSTYRIADAMVARIDRAQPRWRDRTLFAIQPTRVRGMVFEDATMRTVLTADPKTGVWTVTEPRNVAVDSRDATQVARALVKLHADDTADVSPAEAGFPSRTRLGITIDDGTTTWLEIGSQVPGMPTGRELTYVRTPDAPDRVGVLASTGLSRVRKTFSR